MNKNEYRQNIPDKHNGAYRKAWAKAMTGRSMAAAIKAKCLDCCCWDKAEIRDCRVPHCPLYPYRPYREPVLRQDVPLSGQSENKRVVTRPTATGPRQECGLPFDNVPLRGI